MLASRLWNRSSQGKLWTLPSLAAPGIAGWRITFALGSCRTVLMAGVWDLYWGTSPGHQNQHLQALRRHLCAQGWVDQQPTPDHHSDRKPHPEPCWTRSKGTMWTERSVWISYKVNMTAHCHDGPQKTFGVPLVLKQTLYPDYLSRNKLRQQLVIWYPLVCTYYFLGVLGPTGRINLCARRGATQSGQGRCKLELGYDGLRRAVTLQSQTVSSPDCIC